MRNGSSIVAGTIVVAVLIWMGQASNAADPKAILEAARAKSGAYTELVAALTGPDPTLRATVFDEMVKSGDGTLRTLAIETGFASDNSALRALALKYSIVDAGSLNVRFLLDENINEKQKKNILTFFGSFIAFYVENPNAETGTFSARVGRPDATHPDSKASGQVQGLSVSMASGSCKFSGALSEEQKVVGFAECGHYGQVPAEMSFR